MRVWVGGGRWQAGGGGAKIRGKSLGLGAEERAYKHHAALFFLPDLLLLLLLLLLYTAKSRSLLQRLS